MMSGAIGQFLASPTDLIKTRLQMEGRRLLDGLKPRFDHSVIQPFNSSNSLTHFVLDTQEH